MTGTKGRKGEGGWNALPARKREELAYAVEMIREGFAEALRRRTQERYRMGEILRVVLFGSYARGDWVEDPIGRYFSDYDLLVVVNHEDLTDPSEFWGATEERLLEALTAGERLRTPVSLIVHSLEDVNRQLRLGRYFFADIVREGVTLYEAPDAPPFAAPEPLAPTAALTETQAYFDEWFGTAQQFAFHAQDASMRGWSSKAAFELHQAAERLYHCVLLVRSLYSPKTHSLNRLRALCEELDGRLIAIWPKEGRFERRCYELLRSAYVKARYSSQYRIEPEQLDWLMARVSEMQALVETICRERLSDLRRAT